MAQESVTFHVEMTTDTSKSPWYTTDIAGVIQLSTRLMLKDYIGIAEDGELEKHIRTVREQAWKVAPYPSVGALSWLNPFILHHPAHDRILSALKDRKTIIDCGCMVAPDMRQMAYEGAPTDKMYGFDVEDGFFDVGYDFYKDRGRFNGTFFKADFFDDNNSQMEKLKGKIDIIWAAKFLHLFDRPTQTKVAVRLLRLLKPQKGSMLVGSQVGLPEPSEIPVANPQVPGGGTSFWLGNEESFREMWDEVSKLTGMEWDVEVKLWDLRSMGMHKDDGSEYNKITRHNLQFTCTLKSVPGVT